MLSSPKVILATICATLGIWGALCAPGSAQSAPNVKPKLVAQTVTFTPSQKPQPKKTTAGASRNLGFCPQDAASTPKKLSLLVPQNEAALTLESHPTLLAHIPQTSAKQVFFAITRERDGAHIHHATLPIQQSGVMAMKMPQSTSALEVGERYIWSVSMICESALMPDSPTAEGIVERVPGNADFKAFSDPLKRAEKLGQAGIWHDMIANLHQASTEMANSQAQANFQQVLSDAGINHVESMTF